MILINTFHYKIIFHQNVLMGIRLRARHQPVDNRVCKNEGDGECELTGV